MKIVLNYDENTGNITDKNGMFIFTWVGLHNHALDKEQYESTNKVTEETMLRALCITMNRDNVPQ